MSVDLLREDLSPIELLPSMPFRKLVKMMQLQDLKSLRLTSNTLRRRVEDEKGNLFKHWILALKQFGCKATDSTDLERFSSEVKIVEGLEFCMKSPESKEWQPCFSKVLKDHPELKDLQLVLQVVPNLQTLFECLPEIGHILTKLDVSFCHSLDGLEQRDSESFPVLEHLNFGGHLTNEEAACLLGLVKTTLTRVRLCKMLITENFLPVDCCFPHLEEVEIHKCFKITIKGLSQLLQSANITQLVLGEFVTGEFFELEEYSFRFTDVFEDADSFMVSDIWLMTIFENCPQLRVLFVEATHVTGELFTDFTLNYVPELEELFILACEELTDAGLINILTKVGNNLKRIIVFGSKITGESFVNCNLSFPSKIESLEFSSKTLTDSGLINILTTFGGNLKEIEVNGGNVTGEDFACRNLSFPSKIESFHLNYCKSLTDFGFYSIFDKLGPKLRSLKAYQSNISGESFMKNLTFKSEIKLKSLSLFSSKMTDLGLTAMLSKIGQNLRVLEIFDCDITGKSFEDLAVNSVPVLEELKISYCPEISDSRLSVILEKFGTKLKALDLTETKISGESFLDISAELPFLSELLLFHCKNLTDVGLVAIMNKVGKNLKNLYLGCTKISGENFGDICMDSSLLEDLNLSGCKKISIKGLTLILQRFGSKLKRLLMNQTNITGEMFEKQCLKMCPMLYHIEIRND